MYRSSQHSAAFSNFVEPALGVEVEELEGGLERERV
jgi:hypothetical protein